MSKRRRKIKVSIVYVLVLLTHTKFDDNHEINTTYSTDDLDNDVDCKGEGVHMYPMFKHEDVGKDFKLRLGMELSFHINYQNYNKKCSTEYIIVKQLY